LIIQRNCLQRNFKEKLNIANLARKCYHEKVSQAIDTEDKITLHVSLYGSLARYRGGKYVAMAEIELPAGACKGDLLAYLGIPEAERGYLFINAGLCDVPGLSTGNGQVLADGDHIGIFSVDRIWPYQYRDGVVMSRDLTEAMKIHGAMHHSYAHLKDNKTDP
jgi:hypothetical protein